MSVAHHQDQSSEVMVDVSGSNPMSIFGETPRIDRRRHRRHDYEFTHVQVERWDGPAKAGRPFGEMIDLSAGGIRIRTSVPDLRVGAQIRIRLRLPVYAGISPFVAADGSGKGSNEWSGWMTITRMQKVNSDTYDVAGRLVDMREIDRGMLTLYLSAQPLAA
jgi:hypothetical protein